MDRYKPGDRVELPHIDATGTVMLVVKRSKHIYGDRLFVKLDEGIVGSGPEGSWTTNAYSVRRYENAEG